LSQSTLVKWLTITLILKEIYLDKQKTLRKISFKDLRV
jgi:hypothetical protein